ARPQPVEHLRRHSALLRPRLHRRPAPRGLGGRPAVHLALEGAIPLTSDTFPIVIFHNPACGTSRNTLEMIRAAGYEPVVVEYLQAGWTREQLSHLLKEMGATPRDILREKGAPAAE